MSYTIENDGFEIIKDCIPSNKIQELQDYALSLLKYFERKGNLSLGDGELIGKITALENNNKYCFQEFCRMMGESLACQKIACQDDILNKAYNIFKHKNLNLVDCAVFFNHPEVERLQYKWHTEISYFPNCRELLTLWFPWVSKVNVENGTMVVARGSHLKSYPNQKIRKEGHLTQMKIDESYFSNDEKTPCELEIGDAVLFSAKCAHKTGTNLSEEARITMIVRYSEIDAKLDSGWV